MSKKPTLHKGVTTQLYALGKNQSLAEKMARIRKKVTAGDNYMDLRHPEALRIQRKYAQELIGPRARRKLINSRFDPDNPNRRAFTAHEIEGMYVALVKLMAYYGGDKRLCLRDTGIGASTLNHWLDIGRMTPAGAYLIGENVNVPFQKEDLRPDLSPKAWQRVVKNLDQAYADRVRERAKEANRANL